ncbi:MAG: hypothetical protein U0989_04985 [Azonexus sp.]|nr:hypothetical protein [Azonexus sp.]MDZ4314105.1 hypothetical protein [Azonexus sp.]
MKVNRELDANHVFPKMMPPAVWKKPGVLERLIKQCYATENVEFSVLAVREATAQPGRKAFTRAKR